MYNLAKRDYDYAIRICAYLAGSGANAFFTIQQLSSKLLVSKPFATKIIFQLKQSRILKTTRGKKGGVSLALPANEITFFNIFEAIGRGIKISSCILEKNFCPLPPPCNIHKFFIDQENEIIKKLKSTTLNNFAFSDDDIK